MPVNFATMGMFIIDEIHYPPPQEPVYDIMGGAGTYAVLGYRFFAQAAPREIGWFVDVGNDFPPQLLEEIKSWETGVIIRTNQARQTTRGWNFYGESGNEERAFKYTTPKLRIETSDLTDNTDLLASKSFHLICSPERCTSICTTLARDRLATGVSEPFYVFWEPVPGVCSPEEFEKCKTTLQYIDVLSPNALEAAMFLGQPEPTSAADVERVALSFLAHMPRPHAAVILRCGSEGCVVFSRVPFRGSSPCAADSTYHFARFPAYHNPRNPDYCVKDPTGGGNTFIGGSAAGYIDGQNLVKAAIYGSIAAGLAIEQVGVPKLTPASNGTEEKWNGETIADRIKKYCERYGFSLN